MLIVASMRTKPSRNSSHHLNKLKYLKNLRKKQVHTSVDVVTIPPKSWVLPDRCQYPLSPHSNQPQTAVPLTSHETSMLTLASEPAADIDQSGKSVHSPRLM